MTTILDTFAIEATKAESIAPTPANTVGYKGGDSINSLEELFENLSMSYDTTTLLIILGVTLLISVIVFVAIVERQKAPRIKFFRWLREYLNFRKMLIAGLLKFLHLFLATLITVFGIATMFQGGDNAGTSILVGLAIIVVGNLALRLISELFMLIISLWQNITDMRAVIVKDEEAPEEKKPKEKKEKHHKEKTDEDEAPTETPAEATVESSTTEAVTPTTVEAPMEQPPMPPSPAPTTETPVVEAPTSEPPIAETPTSEPPAIKAPTTEPPASEPSTLN